VAEEDERLEAAERARRADVEAANVSKTLAVALCSQQTARFQEVAACQEKIAELEVNGDPSPCCRNAQ
jgi:hypothetical protein